MALKFILTLNCGVGACGEERASGRWSEEECKKHINYLEILADFICFKIFAKDRFDSQIIL